MQLTWAQALAWRMRRQLLDPIGGDGAASPSVQGVVRQLGAIQAGVEAAAERSVRTRLLASDDGAVARALADGRLIKSFAFRGATHLMTPEDGGTWLALRAAGRMWDLPSWQSFYRLTPSDWAALRARVRDALADGPLTKEELGAAIVADARFAHLADAFDRGATTLLKPLTWQGDMSFGPPKGGKATFQRLDGNPRWAGVPALDVAGPRAIEAYLRAYGPATHANIHYWLGEGLGAGRKRITAWIAGSGDALVTISLEGDEALVMADDLDELRATSPSSAVRLLPGYDQWVLGPGTADARVVPAAHRTPVTRGANVVIVGGVVSGTWTQAADLVEITSFAGASRPSDAALETEFARLGVMVGRALDWRVVGERIPPRA